MKKIKDKKIIVLLVILIVFTIGYFVIVNHISYAFSDEYDPSVLYNKTIDVIKEASILYAEKNEQLFEKDKVIYVKVQDLIDNELLATNNEGNIINPTKKDEVMNSNIIKIKKDKNNYTAEVDS